LDAAGKKSSNRDRYLNPSASRTSHNPAKNRLSPAVKHLALYEILSPDFCILNSLVNILGDKAPYRATQCRALWARVYNYPPIGCVQLRLRFYLSYDIVLNIPDRK
jgi:hypothetical protein